ncbi:toll/interleukin-1 receptor domain-containing protein [Variovorax sp. J31P179]|uniref:toll/interleukin-1 receptor domain-containing protein n=1 Tax=Variovorax sp. J31P179 TaxID=3053508 RepID=UPI0025784FCC|nr:toll/interleukin-1 receptor domain-containing protein [Variovorax sp. J31P179]MDM0085067.1 toll/interleukin-1 receptor domain-containing protein [Variovorax sp. J31P179]
MSDLTTLFVSFASENLSKVEDLAAALRANGIAPDLYSENLPVGRSIIGWIDQALSDNAFSLIVASDAYFQKQWTLLEYRAILHKHIGDADKPFFVATVDDRVVLPPLLKTFRHVSLADLDAAALTIAASIKGDDAICDARPAKSDSAAPSTPAVAIGIESLTEREVIHISRSLLAEWFVLGRRSGAFAELSVQLARRNVLLKIATPALRDDLLHVDLMGETELAEVNHRFMASLRGSLDRSGLGIFEPAYELEFDRRRAKFAQSVQALRDMISETSIVSLIKD